MDSRLRGNDERGAGMMDVPMFEARVGIAFARLYTAKVISLIPYKPLIRLRTSGRERNQKAEVLTSEGEARAC